MKKEYYLIAIILLILFSGLMFFMTRFTESSLITRDGFLVSGNYIDEVLFNDNKVAKTPNITLEKVSTNDTFYMNLNKVYIGEDRKTEVNTIYPLFINNGLGIVNLDAKSYIINKNFEYFASYENFTITGGKLYNFGDNEQADYENYILLLLSNKTYVNVLDIEISTNSGLYEVPVNSIINFNEDYFNYYYYDKSGKLIYKIIDGINLKDIISFGNYKYSYEEMLISLDKIDQKEEVKVIPKEEKEEEEYIIISDSTISDSNDDNKEVKYVAPEVLVTEFSPKVYSSSAKLKISDPARAIVGGINFQFFVNDKVYLRKTFISGGNIEITGLVPNTTFKIVGNYKYYNENKKKMELTFFEQEITTLGVENLEPISLSFENGTIYPDKLEIKDLKISSDLASETIKGINKGQIIINDEAINMPTGSLMDLLMGKSITYTTPAKLDSNITIDYEIRFLDAYSNEIKIINNAGRSRTSKNEPRATVKITSSNVNSVRFDVNVKNVDNVKINKFKYIITDSNNFLFEEGTLDSSIETNHVTLKNLNPNATYNVLVLSSYDIEDGQGTLKDRIMGEGKFTTAPLSSLGFYRVVASATELTFESVSISSRLDMTNISSVLLELLYSFNITVSDDFGNVVYTKTYTDSELERIKLGESFDIKINNLNPVTVYNVTYSSVVKQGTVKDSVTVLSAFKNFTTYKKDAEVQIKNEFATDNMIDFDVRIVDLDGAIESGRVLLEIRDSLSNLIGKEYLDLNADYIELTYEKLKQDETYTFTYLAEEYNIGFSNSTYESDYILLEKQITTVEGVSGSVELTSLLRNVTGRNLFNIEDYDRIRKEGNTGYKEYDIKNNTITFGAKNGYVNYSYFVPEVAGKSVQITFKARYNPSTLNKADVYISKNVGQNLDYKLVDLGDDWTEYKFSFYMTTNYIGFIVNEAANKNKKTSVDFKDIQIINNELTESSIDDVTMSYYNSNYIFNDTIMKSGDEVMPDWRTTGEVSGNYGVGHARITNLSTNSVVDFSYTGSEQLFTASANVKYKIELWGAGGGDGSGNAGINQNAASHGGRGAYTSGTITLKTNTNLYVYVGGQGLYGSGSSSFGGPVGGYNGGGNGGNSSSGSGGGATDVRLINGNWKKEESLMSRIMVAGGGGGADNWGGTLHAGDDGSGGAGGTLNSNGAYINGVLYKQYAASQSYGHAFGYGDNVTTNTDTGGAGGGYFGGYASNNNNGGGGGGSSYISGHTGCIAYSKVVESLSQYINYSEDKQFSGTFNINIYDKRNEITTNDYYVRIYRKGELVETYKYDLTSNILENINKIYSFDKNVNYNVNLSIKIRNRFYDIASVEFTTESEIRSITTTSEFFAMHPNGKYIVLNDLDFRNNNNGISTLFYGQLDFQGHKITRNVQNSTSRLFENVRSSAVIKNLVVDYYLDNTSDRSWWYGLITYNYGVVDNIMINVLESRNNANYVFCLCAYVNYGTIQNFVVNLKAPMSSIAAAGAVTWSNQGTLRNGYVYGKNIYGYPQNIETRSRKDIGGLAGETWNNSRIEAVYSLISVEKNNDYGTGVKESVVGNIVGYHGAGYFGNSYSVELSDKTNTNIITQDPNIGTVSGIRASKLYYVSDKIYGGNYSSKISKLALYDKNFQNNTLNIYDGFEVDSFVDLGYFPQVKLNECMPSQEWIELPKVTDADLIDVTSVEEVSNDGDSAVVKLHINNPSSEEITKVTITDINTVTILDQTNSYGKTVLTVKLSNPTAYKSKYFVDTLYIKPAYGRSYTKVYNKNERAIYVDLYYPIYDLNDWKTMVSNPTQNYCLMNDLDFKNTSISNYMVTKNLTAKLDGRGHTIKNITINSGNAMFTRVSGGTIKNLFVENYKKTNNTAYGGFVYESNSNAIFDNVHIKTAQVYANARVGGLVGSASYTTIRNSSVTNFKPSFPTEIENIYIGGLVGYASQTFIENTYVQDVDIAITDAISTHGVGGVAGRLEAGTVNNVYATGNIKCNSVNVGGLVGWSTATISNVWSYVNISAELDYVGGIVGRIDNSNINNTLSIGAVYTSYVSNLGNNVHRTTGNAIATVQSNYSWDKQKYYGYVTGESSAEVLITTEDLEEKNTYMDLIGFDDSFDYSQIEDHILPKLKNSDTMELLPDQKDYMLESELFDVDSVQIEYTATSADIHMVIENPNQYNIESISFNYLRITRSRITNDPEDGTTIIDVTVSPERCYDSYIFNKVVYYDENGEKQNYDKVVRINLQFFHLLATYDDWTHISKTTAENYRLTGDIDFSGKSNINTNVLFARFEGLVNDSGQNYKLMNYKRDNITAAKTSLIKMITTSLKNITFENFEMNSTASLNYVNVIYLNYSSIENVEFNYITINASKSSYVAPIAINRGDSINDIRINHNNITGVNYVAGFLSTTYNTSSAKAVARDCTIYGTGQYIGGIVAYRDYRNGYNVYEYYGYNMNVTGKTDVGGLHGYGGAFGSYIYDSTIKGINGGSNIGGIGGRNSFETDNTSSVNNCTIIADSNNVGGLYGWARHFYNGEVVNTTITQTGSGRTLVGGAFGYQDGYTHSNIGVSNVTITNAGNYTGGITGRLNGGGVLSYCFTSNVTINGKDYVGGVGGSANTARLYYNVTNVNINATGNYVGGTFGYISSIHDSDNNYTAIIYEVLIANSQISGNNYVGGFVGYTNLSQLTPAKFYNNIIVADCHASNTTNTYLGAVNGADTKEYYRTQLTTFRVYENNRLNDEYVKSLNIPVINRNYIINASSLGTQSFYTNFGFATARWDYDMLSSGYFPKVKRASGNTVKPEQLNLKRPVQDVSFSARMLRTATKDHLLPTLTVYSSGINTVNLEFSNSDDSSYFEVYDSGTKVIDKNIEQRTYTMNYDFTTNFEVVVSDGRNSKTYKFKPTDVRINASTYGKKYAYIYNGTLKGNIDSPKNNKFIHIYNNLALTDEMKVYDITTGKFIEKSYLFDISLNDEVIALYTFEYNTALIDTYYNYSVIHKDDEEIIYENQIIVKDGNIQIIDSELESLHGSIIVDNYAKNEYVTVLGTDGVIYDLKTPISMPNNFSNKSIYFMTNNINSDSSVIILIYKTGKVVIFDYRTGKEITLEKATEDVSVIEYFKENFTNSASLVGSEITNNYNEAKNLEKLLTKNPIEVDTSGTYVSSDVSDKGTKVNSNAKKYVTYYNSIRDDYDVIDVSSIINTDTSTQNEEIEVITENNKIYTSNALVEFYMKKSIFKEVFGSLNGLYIFIAILIGLITSLVIGLRNTRILRNSEEEYNGKK